MKRYNVILLLIITAIVFAPIGYAVAIGALFYEYAIKKSYKNIEYKKYSTLLVFLAWCIIATLLAKYKLISLFFMTIIFVCSLVLIYIAENYDKKESENILKLFYIVSLIVFLFGFVQMINPMQVMPKKWVDTEQFKIHKRMFSTFFNPNVFGFYVNLVIIVIVNNIMNIKKAEDIKPIETVLLAIAILCLFLTFSRTAWISIVATLLISCFFSNRSYLKYVIIITIFLLIADFISGSSRADIVKISKDGSFAYRMELWRTAIKVIKDNYFTGIGFGTFTKYASKYSYLIKDEYVEHCHNIYLQVVLESGVIGFGIFVTMIWTFIRNIKQKLIKNNSYQYYKLLLMVLLMTLIHGLVDSVPLTPQILLILAIFVGIIIGQSKSYSN